LTVGSCIGLKWDEDNEIYPAYIESIIVSDMPNKPPRMQVIWIHGDCTLIGKFYLDEINIFHAFPDPEFKQLILDKILFKRRPELGPCASGNVFVFERRRGTLTKDVR